MSRLGWFRLPFLRPKKEASKTGLVLSGGGARASFQIGALKYLYREVGIAPEIFVGTSAGAILASVLAQYSNTQQQAAAVDTLETLWTTMSGQEDMFIERTWFRKLREHGSTLFNTLAAETKSSPEPAAPNDASESLPGEGSHNGEVDVTELPPLAAALSPDVPEKSDWTPGILVSLLTNLGTLARVGGDLPNILKGADRTRSAYRPGPLLARLLKTDVFSGPLVASSGMTLRIATVDLVTGELRYMREDGVLVDRFGVPISTEHYELALGVLASCAIPAVFAPVEIGTEVYVDGGVRENLAAEMAMGQLGSSPTYVITAAPPGVPYDDSQRTTDVFSIMMRSAAILSAEAMRDELAYARSSGAIVIEPEVDVHDVLTVVPELVAINIDYGWIRAAEAVLGASESEAELHRKIIELRIAQHELNSTMLTDEADYDLAEHRKIHYELRAVIAQADPRFLPPGSDAW